MPVELIIFTAGSLLGVLLIRLLPRAFGPNAVAVLSGLVLLLVSWQSAVWLSAGVVITLSFMAVGERVKHRTLAFSFGAFLHLLLLLVLRDLPTLALIGGAYFTLRHIHVMADWWANEMQRPSVGSYLRYQFFLPVIAAGPIHRFGPFERQVLRRRNDPEDLAAGAERLLWGAFQFTALGVYVMSRLERVTIAHTDWMGDFWRDWIISALNWITLYMSFSGLSSMAIGLALMMGLRIEENFREPWRATDLADFWTRWHISLTSFSRDYVFRSASAVSRSAMVGVFCAMLFLGLWHGTSLYWLGWGVWQGLGVLLTIYMQRAGTLNRMPGWTGRLFAALWLIATLPIVSLVTGGTP